MFKKILATTLSMLVLLTVVVGVAINVSASPFVDVKDSDYYAGAAERMAERGILSGYGDGYYYGNQTVTRAQIAALVCKMLGRADEAASLAGTTPFVDVPSTNWSTGYVNYAVANGIILGDGDGNFRPDDSVKYEEVIKVVVCVLGLDEDVEIDPSDWSKEYIEAADKAGLTDNLIGKKGEPMLRSDIAVICDAAMTIIDGDSDDETEKEVVTTTEKKPVIDDEPDEEETTERTTAKTTERTTAKTTERTTAKTTERTTATTEATTQRVTIITAEVSTGETVSPPPPPMENELGEA